MSFGAMAVWQALALLAVVGAAAVAVFRIKVRPPRVSVPSLVLWQRVLDTARALTWWERVRRAVSLVATVLIALALALALTRPAPGVVRTSGGRVLIVLDSSWSMLAQTSGGGTRWARAVAEAHRLAASASGEMVALATTADGLVEGPTQDLALIDTALDRLRPSGAQSGDWPRVAGGAAVHFFTDGSTARAVEPGVVVHSVYEPASNVAITAFDVRPPVAAGASGEAYIAMANYGSAAVEARLRLTRGGRTLVDQAVALGAGETVRTSAPIGTGSGAELRAHLTAPGDALAVDDEAVAWLPDPIVVTVVGEDRGPIAALLHAAPGIEAYWVAPEAYRPGREDVAIFDRWLPAAPPGRPALCILPPASAWLGKPGAEERPARWSKIGSHPVLDGVDPLTIDIKRARPFDGEGLDVIARSDRGTPLLQVVDTPERRLLVLAFGPGESNLASAPAFPVMLVNALEWLGRSEATPTRHPGQAVLPASTTAVIAPDGRRIPVTRMGDRALAQLAAPGLYTVEAGGSRRRVAVNVSDPAVSNLSRSTLPPDASAPLSSGGSQPWWLYALGGAFVLIFVEWWTWQRRITV